MCVHPHGLISFLRPPAEDLDAWLSTKAPTKTDHLHWRTCNEVNCLTLRIICITGYFHRMWPTWTIFEKQRTILVNPFVPSAIFYLISLDRSISYIRGICLVFIIILSELNANSEVPDQTPRSAASDLVYTVCQCPFYGTLGLNGLIPNYHNCREKDMKYCSVIR